MKVGSRVAEPFGLFCIIIEAEIVFFECPWFLSVLQVFKKSLKFPICFPQLSDNQAEQNPDSEFVVVVLITTERSS